MKPSLILLSLLLLGASVLLLTACREKEPEPAGSETADPTEDGEITFVNKVETTDVWILPDTEKNRDLPYSTPTIDELETDGESSLSLSSLGGPGKYVIHMFSADGMYYGADEVPLEAGYTLTFRRQDWGWALDVADRDGKLVDSLEVFGAMWAGDGGGDELDG